MKGRWLSRDLHLRHLPCWILIWVGQGSEAGWLRIDPELSRCEVEVVVAGRVTLMSQAEVGRFLMLSVARTWPP